MPSAEFENSSSTPMLAIVSNPDVIFDKLIDLKHLGEVPVDGLLEQYRCFLLEQWQGVVDLAQKAPEKRETFGDFLGQVIATDRLIAFERDRLLIYQSGNQVAGSTCYTLQAPILWGGGEVLGVNFIFDGELSADSLKNVNALLIRGIMKDFRGVHVKYQRSLEAGFGTNIFWLKNTEQDLQSGIYDKFFWELPRGYQFK